MAQTVLPPKLNGQKLGVLVCTAGQGQGITGYDMTGHDMTGLILSRAKSFNNICSGMSAAASGLAGNAAVAAGMLKLIRLFTFSRVIFT